MTTQPLSLSDLFSASKQDAGGWSQLRALLRDEMKSLKLASASDLMPKIGELFDIELPTFFVAPWKKAAQIAETLRDSKEAPEEVRSIALAEHTIESDHRPYIDVVVNGAVIKRIEFIVHFAATMQAIVLRIRNGVIEQIESGSCEFEGAIKYKDLTVAEKKAGPLYLRGIALAESPNDSPNDA